MTEQGPLEEDVQRILDTVPRPRSRGRLALVLIVGLPGTGKSSFAARVASRSPFVVLESDALRRLIFTTPRYTAAESRRLFTAIHAAADRLLSMGVSCLVDATNLLEAHRQPLYEIAEARGAKLVIVEVVAPREVVHERLRARVREGGGASEADVLVYERMRAQREEISRPHFTVDTTQDVSAAVEEVVRAINDP